jgi:broad specificity phosphatase PhoE
MKQIWLVRHAQSKSQSGEDNDERNPELSDLGRQQAQRLIDPLKAIRLDRILLSPLKRAWQTYQLSQVNAPKVEFDSRIAESNWGIPNYYQGLLPLITPDIAQPDCHNALLRAVEDRVVELVSDLVDSDEESVMLFGHWGVFVHVFRVFVGIEPNEHPVWATMDNTGLSLLELDDENRRYIRFWNERAHVRDLLKEKMN